jgi:hypothetical protein
VQPPPGKSYESIVKTRAVKTKIGKYILLYNHKNILLRHMTNRVQYRMYGRVLTFCSRVDRGWRQLRNS